MTDNVVSGEVKNDASSQGYRDIVKRLVSEGVFLALGTSAIYFLAFLHECGYCTYFGVPLTFISISTANVMNFGVVISLAFLTKVQAFGILAPIWRASHNEKSPELKVFYKITGYFAFLMLILLSFVHLSFRNFAIIVLVWLISLLYVYWPFLLNRYYFKKSFEESMENVLVPSQSFFKEYDILFYLMQRYRVNFGRVPFVLGMLFLTTFLIGRREAERKRIFLVMKSDPRFALISSYDDYFLFCEYDPKLKKQLNGFTILKIGDDDKVELELKDIGPLEPLRY